MEERRIQAYIDDFLSGFDERRFPAAFLQAYEAVECLGYSQWNETLLVKNRATGALAVAKCYGAEAAGERGEGELLRRLDHPAFPTFLAEYRNEGMCCVVRAYVEGETLAHAAAERPLSVTQVLCVGVQLCDALHELHTQTPPIIHRDVKPENIILKQDGRIGLIDFGISREFDQNAKSDTLRFGTAAFAPPEQYGFAQTDCRSDIFSLGMVLGFLLTGHTEIPAIEEGIGARPLKRIIQKCIAFAPKDRYASAAELKRALLKQLPEQKRKRRALCCALGAALLCGLVLAAVSLARSARGNGADDREADAARAAGAIGSAQEQAAEYLNEKYQTDLFTDGPAVADVGFIRRVLTQVYGYDAAYANGQPTADPPMETESSFLPWGLADGEPVSRERMAYIAVKIYWPEVVSDWSSLTDDTGEYPGIRVALPFAKQKGICDDVALTEWTTLADAAEMLYRADRAYGDGLPPQLALAYRPKAKPVSALGFTEPLMERAVRAVLGKSATDAITPEELASVEELYVFGEAVSADSDGFYAAANAWYAAGSGKKGDIASLADVGLLPSLRVLCVAAQGITDLSPLAALPRLEKVEFKHNRVTDISVLAELPALASVGLNDNPVADAAPLGRCANLRFLDLCDVAGYDPAFLDSLGDFEFLDLANATDSYAHLGRRRVRELKLGYTELDTLEWLSGVTGMQALEVKRSKLASLEGIEAHAELTYLNVAACPIPDLSPVLRLPELRTLVVSEDMRPLVAQLGEVAFDVLIA